MADQIPETLSAVVNSLALSAVEVQMAFDTAFRQAVAYPAQTVDELAAVIGRDAAIALLPSRLQVERWEVTANVMMLRGHTREFSLAVRPLNLGFQLKYGSSERVESQLRLQIEQTVNPLLDSNGKEVTP